MNPIEIYPMVGEWNEDKMHGIGQIYYHGGPLNCVWGQFTDGVLNGYVTEITLKGKVQNCWYKMGKRNGYGIEIERDGSEFSGLVIDDRRIYGLIKYANFDEYDGRWGGWATLKQRHGEGIFYEASTGKCQKILYCKDEVKEVLEENVKIFE